MLAWYLHTGNIAIPKTSSPDRMRENFGAAAGFQRVLNDALGVLLGDLEDAETELRDLSAVVQGERGDRRFLRLGRCQFLRRWEQYGMTGRAGAGATGTGTAERPYLMWPSKVQIHVIQAQCVSAVLKGLVSQPLLAVSELGRDEDLLSRNPGRGDRCAHACLIAVGGSCVNVAVAWKVGWISIWLAAGTRSEEA